MFIPIFPVGSMFVTGSEFRKRKGFQIAVNGKSVIAVYGRILSLMFAGWFLFMAYDYFTGYMASQMGNAITYLIPGLIFSALCIYFYFHYGKAKPNDILLRNKMGRLTGYYALPNWFDYGDLRNMLGSFESEYKQKYPDGNWKADLQSDKVEPNKHMLLFGLALFNCMVFDSPENDQLYFRADQLYVLKPEGI
ncbi:hypothetical protein ACFFGT_12970 [Mucilaginibacter angelicae]|uniref:RDD domain-containing protein n=1 Tax=Mucilaginibacter angelicae TaxID=869718 RepID=A0ABV6L6N2_9SPHI